MAQQFLWIEACLKLAGGLALVTAPRVLAQLLGLPSADDRFWPRLLGAVLIGLAAASLIESRSPGAGGLGLAGSIAINLAGAAMIGALLILLRRQHEARQVGALPHRGAARNPELGRDRLRRTRLAPIGLNVCSTGG